MKNYRCPVCGEDMRESLDIYDQTYWYCMRKECLFETYGGYALKEKEQGDEKIHTG